MSSTLFATVVLSFIVPFITGLAGDTLTGQVQTEYGDVLFQVEEPSELRQIPGNPDDLAIESLTYREYDALENLEKDFVKVDGVDYPLKVLIVCFTAETQIGEINAFLRDLKAEIVGVLPGRADILIGLTLVLRVPTQSYEELHSLVNEVSNLPIVENAVEYILQNTLNYVPFNNLSYLKI